MIKLTVNLIVLLLFISRLSFGQLVHDIPCTDNAANTTVTNNGSGSAWTASGNTSTLYDADNGGNFYLDLGGNYVKSNDNITYEKVTIKFTVKFDNAIAADHEYHFACSADGDHISVNNEFFLLRASGEDEWRVRYTEGGVNTQIVTTDHAPNNTTWYTYKFVIDFSLADPTVELYQDGTALTFGAWTSDQGAITVNNEIYLGSSGGYEPDAKYKDFIIYETGTYPSRNIQGYKDIKGTTGYSGY